MFRATGELDLGAEAEDALGPLRRALGRLVNRNEAGGLCDLAVRLKAIEKELMVMSEPLTWEVYELFSEAKKAIITRGGKGEQQMAELLQGKQCEVQLLQREQPMVELLQRKQCEVQLLQREQPMAELLQGKQHAVQLLQE
jgi:hypothetical protein